MPVASLPLRALLLPGSLFLVTGYALAGGPLILQSSGEPFLWNSASPIQYRTDNGPLSATVPEAAARSRVATMFNVWQDVPTSSIAFARAGPISAVTGFNDGDVSTVAEYSAVENDCFDGRQSPVVYDADGQIFFGLGVDQTSVIGFAGPCALGGGQIVSGQVVMNGLFQDGANLPVPDLTTGEFDAAFIHEFGHFAGLDHSQVNVNCLNSCGGTDLVGLPTMFPFLVHSSQGSLSVDDVAWISRLYPQAGGSTAFDATHGTIRGIVYFSDGESHAQLVNVIARQVNAGLSQDRSHAVSVVSGFRFRAFHGNPLTGAQASPFGSVNPGHIGLFEIPVPVGDYHISVESINASFVDGSSVGPFRLAMPGTAPAPLGPLTVGAGSTSNGNDIVLIGTQPRFDQFEGP